MKISVIVPIYNVVDYLKECLESIKEQSFSAEDYEVILVNDGSTDGSDIIANEFVIKESNFSLINKKNGGLSSARNTGLIQATGDYVCFIDSDDYVSPDYLEKMYSAAKSFDADMVFSDYHKVDEDGLEIQANKSGERYNTGVLDKNVVYEALTSVGDNHYATTVIVAWNKLVKREIMKKHTYPEGLIHEDEFVIMPLINDCDRIVWIDDDLYSYRQRINSIMQDDSYAMKHLKVLEAFEERIEISKVLNNADMTNKFIKAYYWNLEVWYYFMRTRYNVPQHKIYLLFSGKMWKQLFRYHNVLWKKKLCQFVIFAIWPEFYLRHFYK